MFGWFQGCELIDQNGRSRKRKSIIAESLIERENGAKCLTMSAKTG
jgi:hypothetical protein